MIPWNQRSVFGNARGVVWWVAVLLALFLTCLGMYADLQLSKSPGLTFKITYFVGCVLAICLVQRKSLFAPMVQPPLIIALAVLGVSWLAVSSPASGDMMGRALQIGKPLIDGFPTMAITTAVTLGIGITRIFLQKKPITSARERTGKPGGPSGPPSRKPRPQRDLDLDDRRPERRPLREPRGGPDDRDERGPERRPRPAQGSRAQGGRPQPGARRPRPQ
ncbi:hypothetical protein D5S17_27420 [Pseudonocardiaceae bacterium YIM PH 21723]|nr:hypothetical protein D5S17_27420 [Pseudonocardiaceae bacterium YIM PH 21723]